MPNAWDSLPNGRRIDAVLAHVRAHPEVWDAALDAARTAALDAARAAAWDAVSALVAWDAVTALVAWDAVSALVAWDAIAALVAWDDCGFILDLSPDAVRLLAASGHQPAILLYPAVIALNSEV